MPPFVSSSVLISISLFVGVVHAESMSEQSASRLITALDKRAFHDTAIIVLDQLLHSEMVSNSFREKIPLSRANERVAIARKTSDREQKQRAYEVAINDFKQLLEEDQDLSIVSEAAFQLGMVFLDMGRLLGNQRIPAEKVSREVGQYFLSAVHVFVGPRSGQTALSAIEKELQQVEERIRRYRDQRLITSTDRHELDRLERSREKLRGRRLQVQLLAAEACSEMAECFEQHSREWSRSLEDALQRYRVVYLSAPTRSAGLWARLEEGRILLALGRINEGQEVLLEITKLPSSENLIYQLRVKAVDALLAAWLDTKSSTDDQEFDERLRQFVLGDSRASLPNSDLLAMKYRSAELLWRRLETLSEDSTVARKSLLADIRILARDVAKAEDVYSESARKLLEKLGRQDAAFAERLGRSFVVSFRHAEQILEQYRNDPTETQRSIALAKLQEVLKIAPSQTAKNQELKKEQLSLLRYQLALLFYEDERYHEAISLSSFLVGVSPSDSIAQKAAVLASAGWQALVSQQDASWSENATAQLAGLASVIMRRWPREQCSADAAEVSINLAYQNGNSAAIMTVLHSLDPDMIGRAEVLLRGGIALWHLYQHPRDGQNRTSIPVTSENLHAASRMLDEGLVTIGKINALQGVALEVAVAGAVARCEMALHSRNNDSLDLFALLTHPRYGPWQILQDSAAELPFSIYEPCLHVCIRGFVKVRRYDLATQVMKILLSKVSLNEEMRLRLVVTSISIGKKLIDAAERREDQDITIDEQNGFAEEELEFIEQLLNFTKSTTDQLQVLSWVAVTFRKLGLSENSLVSSIPEHKRKFFLSEAAVAMEEILSCADLPQTVRTSWQCELVGVRANLGQWDEAVKQMRFILADQQNNRSPLLQQHAADLFQKAAQDAQSLELAREYFQSAVVGSRVKVAGGESVVWGWGSLASRVSKAAFGSTGGVADRMRGVYFEARYQLAACRLAWAQKEVNTTIKTLLLKEAEADIKLEAQLHPALGGDELKKRFNALRETIQQESVKISKMR